MAFSSLSRLLEFIESFANLSGLIHRVSAFDEAVTRCEQNAIVAKSAGELHSFSDSVVFKGVDIVTPADDVRDVTRFICTLATHERFMMQMVAEGISIEVCRNQKGLMVTGPNGSGKTSFFRVLGGLWPVKTGRIGAPISVDGRPNVDQVFLVPQRIYMAQGTLAQQIHYPVAVELTDELKTRLQLLLDLVGIG